MFHKKKTGDVYRGNWEQGLKSGAGVYEYEDGELGKCWLYRSGGAIASS